MVNNFEHNAQIAWGTVTIRCEICRVQESTSLIRQCHICGRSLCAEHYKAGLCPEHFQALDATQQAQLLALYPQWSVLGWRITIGAVPVILLVFFFAILVPLSIINPLPWGIVIGVPSCFLILSVWICFRWSKQEGQLKCKILAIINTLDPLELEHLQKLGFSNAEIEKMKADF